jgi:hypothetical protein
VPCTKNGSGLCSGRVVVHDIHLGVFWNHSFASVCEHTNPTKVSPLWSAAKLLLFSSIVSLLYIVRFVQTPLFSTRQLWLQWTKPSGRHGIHIFVQPASMLRDFYPSCCVDTNLHGRTGECKCRKRPRPAELPFGCSYRMPFHLVALPAVATW